MLLMEKCQKEVHRGELSSPDTAWATQQGGEGVWIQNQTAEEVCSEKKSRAEAKDLPTKVAPGGHRTLKETIREAVEVTFPGEVTAKPWVTWELGGSSQETGWGGQKARQQLEVVRRNYS